ncbi:MAG: tripartite tricarboxylate transporter TctB family protein [Alphaproteobacteria bacterium]|nr:tripartite tricarboxylate transporter TctB family protein [Alphaproteobacteria bacterium]
MGIVLMAMFLIVLVEAARYPRDARLFPTVIGAAGLAMAALHLVRSLTGRLAGAGRGAGAEEGEDVAGASPPTPLWIAVAAAPTFGIVMWLFGFWIATGLVVFLGPWVMGYRNLARRVLLTVGTLAVLAFMFPYLLNVPLPTGLVWDEIFYVDDED